MRRSLALRLLLAGTILSLLPSCAIFTGVAVVHQIGSMEQRSPLAPGGPPPAAPSDAAREDGSEAVLSVSTD